MYTLFDKLADWFAVLASNARRQSTKLSHRFLYAIALVLSFLATIITMAGVVIGTIVAAVYLLSLAIGLGWAVFVVCATLAICVAAAVIVSAD